MRRLCVPIQAVSLKGLPRREMFGYLLVWSTDSRVTFFEVRRNSSASGYASQDHELTTPLMGFPAPFLSFARTFLTARIDDTPLRLVTRAGVSETLTNPWAANPAWRAHAWANSQFAYG